MQLGGLRSAVALIFPGEYSREILVITQGFTIRSLMFFAKMTTARFVSRECVSAHQFGELQEISNPSCSFQRLIKLFAITRDTNAASARPKFLSQHRNTHERF